MSYSTRTLGVGTGDGATGAPDPSAGAVAVGAPVGASAFASGASAGFEAATSSPLASSDPFLSPPKRRSRKPRRTTASPRAPELRRREPRCAQATDDEVSPARVDATGRAATRARAPRRVAGMTPRAVAPRPTTPTELSVDISPPSTRLRVVNLQYKNPF